MEVAKLKMSIGVRAPLPRTQQWTGELISPAGLNPATSRQEADAKVTQRGEETGSRSNNDSNPLKHSPPPGYAADRWAVTPEQDHSEHSVCVCHLVVSSVNSMIHLPHLQWYKLWLSTIRLVEEIPESSTPTGLVDQSPDPPPIHMSKRPWARHTPCCSQRLARQLCHHCCVWTDEYITCRSYFQH